MILFKVPFVTQIYSAAKQIGQAIDPTTETSAFKSCVLIRHPRHGEYALAFVTGETTLQDEGSLLIVYVPTNHAYVGDIYMLVSLVLTNCRSSSPVGVVPARVSQRVQECIPRLSARSFPQEAFLRGKS